MNSFAPSNAAFTRVASGFAGSGGDGAGNPGRGANAGRGPKPKPGKPPVPAESVTLTRPRTCLPYVYRAATEPVTSRAAPCLAERKAWSTSSATSNRGSTYFSTVNATSAAAARLGTEAATSYSPSTGSAGRGRSKAASPAGEARAAALNTLKPVGPVTATSTSTGPGLRSAGSNATVRIRTVCPG